MSRQTDWQTDTHICTRILDTFNHGIQFLFSLDCCIAGDDDDDNDGGGGCEEWWLMMALICHKNGNCDINFVKFVEKKTTTIMAK